MQIISNMSGGGESGCWVSRVSGTGWCLREGLPGWRWHKLKKMGNLESLISLIFRENPENRFKPPWDKRNKSHLTCEPWSQPEPLYVWSEDAWVRAYSHSIHAVLADSFLWASQWSDGERMTSGGRKKAKMADTENTIINIYFEPWVKSGEVALIWRLTDKFLTAELHFDALTERNNHLFLDAALTRHFLEHLLQVAYIHTQLTPAFP